MTVLQTITYDDFERALRDDVYYKDRWDSYLCCACELAQTVAPQSVLELGPHRLPLFPGGDTIDFRAANKPTLVHDAANTPWPVESDRYYDLFVSLHVWEHLGDRQQDAFREVQRVARFALLSIPYRWDVPDRPHHHMIDREIIDMWCCGVKPIREELRGSPIRRRLLRLFDF